MTLFLEVLGPNDHWVLIGQLDVGSPDGSMSNHTDDGKRELYHFGCESAERSVIYRSNAGVDFDLTPTVRVASMDISQLEVIADLRPGDSHVLELKTDVSKERRRVRFRQA